MAERHMNALCQRMWRPASARRVAWCGRSMSLWEFGASPMPRCVLVASRRLVFTGDRTRARVEKYNKYPPEETTASFLAREVVSGMDLPSAKDVEERIPTLDQLRTELPSSDEIRQAMKEGRDLSELGIQPPEKDED